MEDLNLKKLVFTSTIALSVLFSFSQVVNAEEELFFQKPNSENEPVIVLEDTNNILNISEENNALINKAIILDSENKTYIDSIIDSYIIEEGSTLESYNEMINEAVISLIANNEETNKKLEELNEELKEATKLPQKSQESRAVVDPITLARLAYDAGVLIVKNKPAPMTASYMNHAKVASIFSANPPNVVHNNDAWAKKVATDDGLNGSLNERFFNEIYGKQSGTLKGVYLFNYGDPAYALAHATYSVTFVRQSNGGYKATFKITDYYDFDYSNYDDFAVGFGNNYCLAMQTLGLIKPFNISISYTM